MNCQNNNYRVIVDLNAIVHNVKNIEKSYNVKVMGVIKANAYGHGAVPVARAFIKAGVSYLGIAKPSDAVAIRRAGVNKSVGILSWLISPNTNLKDLIDNDIDISVGSFFTLDRIVSIANGCDKSVRIQVKLEVQSGRDGFCLGDEGELKSRLRSVRAMKNVRVTGVWGHFSMADNPKHNTNRELGEYIGRISRYISDIGYRRVLRHACNSTGLLTLPQYHFDMVRPASFCFGLSSDDNSLRPSDLGLRPSMTIVAKIAGVHTVYAGDGIGYGHEWVANKTTKIGVIYFGYADGMPHINSGRVKVFSRKTNRYCDVVGSICMDQIFVDLGANSVLDIGDEIEVFGKEPCLIGDLAMSASTMHANILANLREDVLIEYKYCA